MASLLNIYTIWDVDSYLSQELPKASWKSVIVNLAIAAVVYLAGQALGGPMAGAVINGILIASVFFLLSSLLLHIIAKIMGGAATAAQMFHLASLIALALSPALATVNLLTFTASTRGFAFPLQLIMVIYSLLMGYKAMTIAHKLGPLKGIIAIIAWWFSLMLLGVMALAAGFAIIAFR